MGMTISIGTKFTGKLFNASVNDVFVVVFIAKQNSNFIRLKSLTTIVEKLIKLDDPQHDIKLCA